MNHVAILVSTIILLASAAAQPRVVSVEELPLGAGHHWQHARFSPTGENIYYTSSNFQGIWKYSVANRTASQITDEPGSGFGFSISSDETKITYRKTEALPSSNRRIQSVVLQDLRTESRSVLGTGRNLTPPTFVSGQIHFRIGDRPEALAVQAPGPTVQVLGIEGMKIALQKGTEKVLLDPLGTGRYIWPSVSPDGRLLVAYQMEQGAFVSDLAGNIIARLGRRDAPSWTHDGKWIAYMDDRDDGHKILTSDIMVVSPDGLDTIALTVTPDTIEMNPSCSPTEKKILFNTPEGKIFLLTYTE